MANTKDPFDGACRCAAADTPHTHPRYMDNSYWEAVAVALEPNEPIDPVPVVHAGVAGEVGTVDQPATPPVDQTPQVPATPEAH